MSNEKKFEFHLGDTARIKVSGEQGEVTGCADYKDGQNGFLLRYQNAAGVACSKWWGADALEKVED